MSDQDRELLELAAKAAGIDGGWGEVVNVGGEDVDLSRIWFRDESQDYITWSPLEDDGDALRLAADLDVNVEWFPKQRYVSAGRLGVGESIGWVDESGRRGALRRAITVAASRIGRAMP